jgi:lipopolysaccharide transport system permease protein
MKENSYNSEDWKILRPNRNWLKIDVQELKEYRDLLLILVQRDLSAKYKQTILGPLWYFAQPLAQAAMWAFAMNTVGGAGTDGVPPFLFQLSGFVLWGYFTVVMTQSGTTFTLNAAMFTKVYFPRILIPLATALSGFVVVGIQLFTLATFYIYYSLTGKADGLQLSPLIVLAPLIFLQVTLITVGFGFWMSSLTAKYRDLANTMAFVIQIGMFTTPVLYPISTLREKSELFSYLVIANPFSMPVEVFRNLLYGTNQISTSHLLISIATTILLFISGWFMFQRTDRTFVDTV